jgi:hypothetical protein
MRRILLLPLCVALAGCAVSGGGLSAFEREQLERRERGLAMATQRVHDPATLAHLGGLLLRLDPAARLRLYVLEHPAPQAELIGEQVLLVRTGLLDAVRSDDELAFVLAHELAHRALGHVAARRAAGWDAMAAEIAADARASARLGEIGLDAKAGAVLLGRLLPDLPEEAQPLVIRRMKALGMGIGR